MRAVFFVLAGAGALRLAEDFGAAQENYCGGQYQRKN
jgi:hypothetical protein